LKLHKVGIGTDGKDKGRMQQLIEQGWIVQGLWRHRDKHKTFQWEKEIFKQLEQRFATANLELPGFAGKADKHWFEYISAQAISITELTELISQAVSQRP
jgi:hypothetical protein